MVSQDEIINKIIQFGNMFMSETSRIQLSHHNIYTFWFLPALYIVNMVVWLISGIHIVYTTHLKYTSVLYI